MRRILLLVTVAAVMAAMVAFGAAPAMATGEGVSFAGDSGGGSSDKLPEYKAPRPITTEESGFLDWVKSWFDDEVEKQVKKKADLPQYDAEIEPILEDAAKTGETKVRDYSLTQENAWNQAAEALNATKP